MVAQPFSSRTSPLRRVRSDGPPGAAGPGCPWWPPVAAALVRLRSPVRRPGARWPRLLRCALLPFCLMQLLGGCASRQHPPAPWVTSVQVEGEQASGRGPLRDTGLRSEPRAARADRGLRARSRSASALLRSAPPIGRPRVAVPAPLRADPTTGLADARTIESGSRTLCREATSMPVYRCRFWLRMSRDRPAVARLQRPSPDRVPGRGGAASDVRDVRLTVSRPSTMHWPERWRGSCRLATDPS